MKAASTPRRFGAIRFPFLASDRLRRLPGAPFRDLPFGRVGWSYASNDCTMRRAAQDDLPAYLAQVREELPPQGVVYEIAGGNHEQYGSYGSPGPAQGLAYKDLPASITEREQRALVAAAIAATARPS